MHNYMNYLREINFSYWGSRTLPIVFILSMIVIFSIEKVQWKRILMFWYTTIVMGCMFTPIAEYIGRKLWNGSLAYFSRLFSVLPILFVITYAVILLFDNLKKIERFLILIVLCVGICIFGDCFYTAENNTKAQNLEKLPVDVIEICDFVHSDSEDVTIAVPSSISPYIRQYDDSLYMPYGRITDGGNFISNALNNGELDMGTVKSLIKEIRKKGCDYFVQTKTVINYDLFLELGYEPVLTTDFFYVYDMHGHKRIHKVYDADGRIIEKQFISKSNKLYNGEKRGYAIIKYDYNENGEKISARYYDKDDNLVKTKNYEN